jgi:hypothetical protein
MQVDTMQGLWLQEVTQCTALRSLSGSNIFPALFQGKVHTVADPFGP